MTPFKGIKLYTLLDILSDFTDHCTKMEATSSDADEIKSCRQTIQLLQAEIDFRNQIKNIAVIAR